MQRSSIGILGSDLSRKEIAINSFDVVGKFVLGAWADVRHVNQRPVGSPAPLVNSSGAGACRAIFRRGGHIHLLHVMKRDKQKERVVGSVEVTVPVDERCRMI